MPMVDSTSDARTVNNVLRHEYRILSEDEKAQMKAVKDAGLSLLEAINAAGAGRPARAFDLARTNAEVAVMWAVKGITG